jgi:hypothetical protein
MLVEKIAAARATFEAAFAAAQAANVGKAIGYLNSSESFRRAVGTDAHSAWWAGSMWREDDIPPPGFKEAGKAAVELNLLLDAQYE